MLVINYIVDALFLVKSRFGKAATIGKPIYWGNFA